MKKLLAIDGNSILNRAFYGIRPLTTKDGFPTNALYGMINMITRQADALKPDFCAVAFDLKAPTFRHKMYDAYKAGRHATPEELLAQFPVAKEVLSALGYHVLEMEGYEADDILGTLARMSAEGDCEAYLMTGDRDALQLISPNVHVLLATNNDTIDMDEAKFLEKYTVPSSTFVDVKALMGDSSDNIPGVPGIGEKTAIKLISEFGSLDGIYEHLPEAKLTPSVKAKLESGRESAYLSQTLARICQTVPLEKELDALAYNGINRDELRRLLIKLEFSVFIKRFGLDAEPTPEEKEAAPVTVAPMDCAKVSSLDVIALDCKDGVLTLSDGSSVWTCEGGEVTSRLSGKTVVCYDCKSLYKNSALAFLRECRVYDLMLGAYLANSSKSNFDLASLVSDYLGEVMSGEVPAAAYIARLYPLISQAVEESGQAELLTSLEMPLALVLADMEMAGFRIDRE
ncbi:MAG: DNA polymerase I, partial [Clostridia bacterium]|nr:DNA polymerase I [Clostridia bacterium]